MTYYELRGTLNPNRKLEWATAKIATRLSWMAGVKAKETDFMPYRDNSYDDEEEQEEISLEDAMRLWK